MNKIIDGGGFRRKFNYNVVDIDLSTTGTGGFSMKQYSFKGNFLYVNRLQVSSQGAADGDKVSLYIVFNEQTNQKILLKEGMRFHLSFDKFYLDTEGATLIGGGSYNKDIQIITTDSGFIESVEESRGGRRCFQLAALTEDYLLGTALGIMVMTNGNVDTVDWEGNDIDFDNIPAGTFLPISPKKINATSTAATIIIFKD